MFIWKKLLKYQYMENVTDIVFFMVCKIYFPLVLSKRWIRREYTDAMQKGITSSIESDVASFTFAT